MTSKWMQQLNKMEGAIVKEYNPFAPENVLRSASPSLNWIFGKGSGLPFGYSAIFYGPPKGGKSLASYLLTSQLHKDFPGAICVRFDTEMRAEAQVDDMWGIDKERFQAYNVNDPTEIYDRIANDFKSLLEQGMPLKMIIIDSLQGMKGVKRMGKDSVADHLMGDDALTHTIGLKNILPIIRKYKIALICTSHLRANLDAGMYGPKEKMAGGWAQKHFFEYFISVKKDGAAASKIENDDIKDIKGKKEIAGHRIFVKMEESSVGVAGRTAQFALEYDKGLVRVEEEIFELTKNLNLVERPNNRTYIVDGKTYTSKDAFIAGIKNDEELAKILLEKIYATNVV